MIVIVGESGSGKSTVQNMLCKLFDYNKLVTYTTRPMREGELDGVDYHFISDKDFSEYKKNGYFVESATYNGWYYGVGKTEMINKLNTVAVLTPHGLRELKKVLDNDKILSVYINVPRRDRLIKLLERGDDIEEAYRRSLSDVGQFDGIKDEVKHVLKNTEYKTSPDILATVINDLYSGYENQYSEKGVNN